MTDAIFDLTAVIATAFLLMIAVDVDGSIWRHRFALEQRYEMILTACTNGVAFEVGPTRLVQCYPTELQ